MYSKKQEEKLNREISIEFLQQTCLLVFLNGQTLPLRRRGFRGRSKGHGGGAMQRQVLQTHGHLGA